MGLKTKMTRQAVPKVCKAKRQNSNIFFFFSFFFKKIDREEIYGMWM